MAFILTIRSRKRRNISCCVTVIEVQLDISAITMQTQNCSKTLSNDIVCTPHKNFM
ncbi:Uncharacterised protein [Serratia rubidaea]|uniref:Uncharacterized protein n=1 Tax=Serratia rubidaea TaxID=61652 RepID=A0A3S4H2P3_SERRU|nr:Uncharacterised protein [Klebsiella variicola]VEA68124.1 Uncharacterised protein [Serratia rubidaea]